MQALVLDHDPDDIKAVIHLLQQAGYNTTVISSLQEARMLLEYQPFDLLVFETRLPDGDVLPLCAEIRERYDATPIMICLTREPDLERRIAVLQLGADDVIMKPYAHVELLARIEALQRRAKWR